MGLHIRCTPPLPAEAYRKICAPIEDGLGCPAPYMVLYNGATMLFTGTDYLIPQDLQTEGIPWLAVDGPRGYLYFEWLSALSQGLAATSPSSANIHLGQTSARRACLLLST